MFRDVLHVAFLSHDGTGPRSILEQAVLEVTGVDDYDTLQLLFLEAMQDMIGHGDLLQRALAVIPRVFEGATAGDEPCKHILMLQAEALGEAVTGLVHKMRFEQEAVDVVLGGSIFKGSNPLLVDRLALIVHESAPLARLTMPPLDPVLGACIMALEMSGGGIAQKAYGRFAGQTV